MVFMRTWKESCQMTFFTLVSSLTFKAKWLNLCKYLTHESRQRQWRWSWRLLWLWTWQCLKTTVCNCPSALKSSHCHNPSSGTLQRSNLEVNTLLQLGTNRGHKLEPQKQSCSHAWHGRAGTSVHQWGASWPFKRGCCSVGWPGATSGFHTGLAMGSNEPESSLQQLPWSFAWSFC